MTHFGRRMSLALAVAVSMPGVAQARCWGPTAVTSARIKDFDTMLMVGALKCRLKGNDVVGRYNRFVQQSRPILSQANEALRTHFEGEGGLDAYDRYATALANRFGGDAAETDCDAIRDTLDELAEPMASVAELESIAKRTRLPLRLPGQTCPTQITAHGD
jgi:hypothetical protein